jgi:ketosteroid isomerase-like protein
MILFGESLRTWEVTNPQNKETQMNRFAGVMPHVAVMGLLGFTALSPCWAQTPVQIEKELIRIQHEWADARIKRDVAFLENQYAKEFRITAMNGAIVERDADIAVFASGDLKPESIVDEDMNVSVYGDVAVVTGRENLRGTYKGVRTADEIALRFTNVFVRRDGRWQLVTHHSTEMREMRIAAASSAQIASPEVLVDEFIKAWNSHEGKSFERVFTKNAIFVPSAEYMNEGRDRIVEDFRVAHTGWAKTVGLALSSEKKVLPLGRDVAVIFFHTQLLHEGKPVPGIDRALIMVAVNELDGWRIAAGQLTKESPKRPATHP